MLVKILSDLHLGRDGYKYVDHGEYVCILAGDIAEGMRGVNWAEYNIPQHIKVLYVPGNHEYYGHEYEALNITFSAYNQQDTHVKILMNEVVDISGIKFAGTTLWTNFCLYNDPLSSFYWATGLNDHRWIKFKNRNLRSLDVMQFNADAISFLEKVDADVLVTHYGVPQSEHPRWAGHELTPGFLTKIPQKVHSKFKYHIHGHTHDSWDYELPYGTRVICNPKGYGYENANFNEELVINI